MSCSFPHWLLRNPGSFTVSVDWSENRFREDLSGQTFAKKGPYFDMSRYTNSIQVPNFNLLCFFETKISLFWELELLNLQVLGFPMPQKFAKHRYSFDSFVKHSKIFRNSIENFGYFFENLWMFHRKFCMYIDKFSESQTSKVWMFFGWGTVEKCLASTYHQISAPHQKNSKV